MQHSERAHRYLDSLINLDRWRGEVRFSKVLAYCRQSCRFVNGHELLTLQIANVDVGYKYRHEGQFKRFLQAMKQLAKTRGRTLIVECVGNIYLHQYLKKNDYTSYDQNGPFSSYYLDDAPKDEQWTIM